MLKFAVDENFNGKILRGLWRRNPDLDIVRIQDMEIAGAVDPVVLAWAAREQRIVMSHDVNTLTGFAYERTRKNLSMPGLFEVDPNASFREIIDDILLLAECSLEGEWEGQVLYIPLKWDTSP